MISFETIVVSSPLFDWSSGFGELIEHESISLILNFENTEWASPSSCQFGYSFVRYRVDENHHILSLLINYRGTNLLIIIDLLSPLCYLHVSLHHLKRSSSPLYDSLVIVVMGDLSRILVNVGEEPTKRGVELSSMEQSIGSETSGLMTTAIVGKYDLVYIFWPVSLFLRRVDSQHAHQGAIHAFYQSISFWLVR